eukprot:scaffold27759_cov31-Tisochrysis_lutea.AAC.1
MIDAKGQNASAYSSGNAIIHGEEQGHACAVLVQQIASIHTARWEGHQGHTPTLKKGGISSVSCKCATHSAAHALREQGAMWHGSVVQLPLMLPANIASARTRIAGQSSIQMGGWDDIRQPKWPVVAGLHDHAGGAGGLGWPHAGGGELGAHLAGESSHFAQLV